MAVITSRLKLSRKPVTPHRIPRARILGNGNRHRSDRYNRVERKPPILPREVEFSLAELGVHRVYESGRHMHRGWSHCSIEGLDTCAGAQGQTPQGSFPAQISAVNLTARSVLERDSVVSG